MLEQPTETPANPNIAPRRYSPFWFRLLEIIPGAIVWFALLLPFLLSMSYPLAVTLFIIIFDVYWLITAFNYAFILISGYWRLRHNLNFNWQAELAKSQRLYLEEEAAEAGSSQFLDWQELYHAVILTTYQESEKTLDASIRSVITSRYPEEKLIMVLACEERDRESAHPIAKRLQERFGDRFFKFLITTHPDGIAGEVKAKGANVTWAAQQLTEWVEKEGIRPDRVIVSTADGDTRFHPSYFLCLSYHYTVLPNRIRCAYQPIAMYFNNIWQAPMFSRVIALGSTFWQMIESVRDYRMITFATHAMSLQTLIDIDYWCTSIVNEDSRQFFRAYFHYEGDFQNVPLFMPIYLDAVHAESIVTTARNLYFQQQRWAYGVEHFPYIVLEGLRHPKIPFWSRYSLIYRAFVGSFSWATASFFITLVGWIPILLNSGFRDQVAVSNFLVATRAILSFTWIGLVISGTITLLLLPPMPRQARHKTFLLASTMILQWAFMPITAIFFGSFPGLHAQTRLMLGRYLGFRVTPKGQARKAAPVVVAHESV